MPGAIRCTRPARTSGRRKSSTSSCRLPQRRTKRTDSMRDIQICEVGPRDGLQNAKHLMPTEAKKRWISALAAAGVEEIEVGSFVPPKLIPAMADTGEIVAHALTLPGVKVVALAPNMKGFERALAAGAHKVTFPVSASRKHSESNVRMTPEEIVEQVRRCVQM